MHENYVLVPADKACNNVIVVCKHYYKQVLTKELICSSMYSRRRERVNDLIEAHDSYMLEHNISIPEFLNAACAIVVVDLQVTRVRGNFVEDEYYQITTEFQETSLRPAYDM